MHDIVAPAGETGNFVGFYSRKQIRIGGVDSTLFEGSGAEVAVQAFAVVVRFVEANGIMRLAKILHVNVVQPVKFGPGASKHRIVCVTGIAGLIGGDAVILKVRRSQVSGIIYVQALAVSLHGVTG